MVIITKLENINIQEMRFQQDGGTCQTADVTFAFPRKGEDEDL